MAPINYRTASYEIIAASWAKIAEKNTSAEVFYTDLRTEIQNELNAIIQSTRSADTQHVVIQIAADVLALRQRMSAEIHAMMSRYTKAHNGYKKILGDRREFYSTGYGLKVADTKLKELLDRDLSEWQTQLKIVETHIEFLRDTAKICDSVGFTIKNRVELLRYSLGSNN